MEHSIARLWNSEAPQDLIYAIKLDHESLKDLIKILKDPKQPNPKKQVAFVRFRSLLLSHSKAEEKALYTLSRNLKGLELKTDEGHVEHQVTEDLLKKIKPLSSTSNTRHWKAQLQVLADLVEHHLKEEERDLLPVVRRRIDVKTNEARCKLFIRLRTSTQKKLSTRNAGALESRL